MLLGKFSHRSKHAHIEGKKHVGFYLSLSYRELLRAVTTACILEGKEGLKLLYSPTLLLFRENPSTRSTIKIFY